MCVVSHAPWSFALDCPQTGQPMVGQSQVSHTLIVVIVSCSPLQGGGVLDRFFGVCVFGSHYYTELE